MEDIATLPPTLTVERAGELLGLSRSAAYRAAEKGDLPTIRFGRRLFVPTPKLLTLLGAEPRLEPEPARVPPVGVVLELATAGAAAPSAG